MNRFVSMGEVRLGLRLIVKQPILSATVVLALATGICLSTMGFTLRDEIVNAKLPYAGGERFGRLEAQDKDRGRIDLDPERYHAFRDRATSFEHLGAFGARPFTLTHNAKEVESIRGAYITPRSMGWVEASPALGRNLIPADAETGAERVAVIRESLWRRRYSADPGIIGRQLTIGGQPRTVVGIMPDTFEFPSSPELWMPLEEATLGGGASGIGTAVRIFGVLRADATFEQATTEVNELSQRIPSTTLRVDEMRIRFRPFASEADQANLAVSALVGVLVMVLLVVASNVATLVFARTWSRAPELAVRTALGAPRTRVVGQLFLETLVLGSIAAVIGMAGSYGSLSWIKNSFEGWPYYITLSPNPRIVLFVVALTLLVSAVTGLLPALRVTRHDLRKTLYGGRGFAFGGFGKVGALLLVVEIALSVALLNGAVTMARAFNAYFDEIPALPKNQILTAQLGRIQSPEIRDRIVAAARELPGVLAAGAGQQLPRLYPPPRPTAVEPIGDEPTMTPQPAPGHAVGDGFMEAIGAHATSGRLFNESDFITGAAPVAIVNEPFVSKFLGGRNPIGRRIRVDNQGAGGLIDDDPRERSNDPQPWREIVGVVPDLGLSVADPALAAGFYLPVRDELLWYLVIRTTNDPLTLAPALRAAVANVDVDLQLEQVRTLEAADQEERVFLSGIATALTAMGGMALMLSVVGIYALLSFMVTRRTREIGIRVALGAQRWQVLRSITGAATAYLLIGGVIGTALGVFFVELRSMILISIPTPGVWMPSTIFLILAIAGLTACWLPGRRALGIRPSEALNAD
jgi:putative ABC transport system permease protein